MVKQDSIKELFLFPNYKVIVFEATHENNYFTVKSPFLCYSAFGKNADLVDVNFSNSRIELKSSKVWGKVSELTDTKCSVIFKEARYTNELYPNFSNGGVEEFLSPLDSIKSFLIKEGLDLNSILWLIIPIPAKKLSGVKQEFNFSIIDESFLYYTNKKLTVYSTKITENTKEIKYEMEIPYYLYDFLIFHPEIEKRPTSRIIQTNTFSMLFATIDKLGATARELKLEDRASEKAKKKIFVKFNSAQSERRDNYNFGYVGKHTGISYQYFIGYNIGNHVTVSKRYESGKGFVEIPTTQRRVYIGNAADGFNQIEWTQEREDFLNRIEIKFKELSDNLNQYLNNLDAGKIDLLIANGQKLLSSSNLDLL